MRTSSFFLLLSCPVIALGLLRYRHDYRARGRSSSLGIALLLAAWIMPHAVMGFSIPLFPTPHGLRQWAGYALMALGLVGWFLVVWRRFSPAMVVGSDAGTLVTDGAYRWSRNPQYVTYMLFPAGYALTGRAAMAWVAVAFLIVSAHLTVLVEEEHLEGKFGDRYRAYRASTPRYLVW